MYRKRERESEGVKDVERERHRERGGCLVDLGVTVVLASKLGLVSELLLDPG